MSQPLLGRNSFVPFVTAGHPDLEATRDIVVAMASAGADLVEIGIPFSDPIADGPVIQRSSHDALRHGYSMGDYIDLVREIRQKSGVRLIFMTYLNPVMQYGLARLDQEGSEAGLDGILISDLIPEEAGQIRSTNWKTHPPEGQKSSEAWTPKLKSVFLVAPTSSKERVLRICEATTGFVYVVARTGVTGKQTQIDPSLKEMVSLVRQSTDLPVAVGFGVRSRNDVRRIWKFADAAVVGTAIVAFVEDNRDRVDLPERVGKFLRDRLLPERVASDG